MKFNARTRKFSSVAIFVFLISVLPTFKAWTKVEYDSQQLMMKNADQISEMVRKKIKASQEIQAKQEDNDDSPFVAEPAAIVQLKDALRIVLARPDQDGTRANAFARLRRELTDLNSLDATLDELAREAISSLQNPKVSAKHAGTYIMVLENLMAEIKPEMKNSPAMKKIIEQIRDANIKVSDETKSQVFLRSMSPVASPSDTALKIIPKDKK